MFSSSHKYRGLRQQRLNENYSLVALNGTESEHFTPNNPCTALTSLFSDQHNIYIPIAGSVGDFEGRQANVPPKWFVLDLDPKPLNPYIPPASYVAGFFVGSYHIPSRQSWVVHGRVDHLKTPSRRPPLEFGFSCLISVLNKTVLKGRIVMGIITVVYQGISLIVSLVYYGRGKGEICASSRVC